MTPQEMQSAILRGDPLLEKLFGGVDPEVEEANYDVALVEYNRCKMYREVFSTTAGNIVLQDLYDKHVLVPQFDPELKNPEVRGFFREGAKSIVLEINRLINKAGGPPPSQPVDNELNL